MASEFVGYTVLLTLNSPPNAKLQGVVANVLGQQLVLHDVKLFWNGQHFPSYAVDSSRIADLEVAPARRNDSISESQTNIHPAHQTTQSNTQELSAIDQNLPNPPQAQTQSFVDPAILSYAKPPSTRLVSHETNATNRPAVTSPVMIGDSAPPTVLSLPKPIITKERADSSATATLSEPFIPSAIENAAPRGSANGPENIAPPSNIEINATGVAGTVKQNGKKSRRGGGRNRGKDVASQTAPGIIDLKDLDVSPNAAKKPGKSPGWRQTPLIEEAAPPRAKHLRNKKSLAEEANGWATEDATDIQDMGEFDFASNLSKFDKRRVFEDIRSKDTTADSDRLVSFNRRFKPGTNGGKNLHHSENVLDTPAVVTQWKSEAGETEDEIPVEERYSSSRASRRELSKTRTGVAPSRKGSAVVNQIIPTNTLRGASPRNGSPRPSISRIGTSPLNGSVSRATFRLNGSNKLCATVSPLQMLEIEQLCTSELGITEDMLTENAGRGIAEAATKHTAGSMVNANVLVLVGNHKSGARAIAAARHLRNHNTRISVCILDGDREDLLLESLRRQLDIYKRGGGWVVKWDELQPKLAEWAPSLTIDALLGMHAAFEDLQLNQQNTAFEMIRWTERSNVPTLSVDVPSGLLAGTGEVTQTDSGPLIVKSTGIICLGAPKNGLLEAMAVDEEAVGAWQVSVADIGISAAAWKKYGTRRRHGVDFGNDWVVDLNFHA